MEILFSLLCCMYISTEVVVMPGVSEKFNVELHAILVNKMMRS